MSDENENDDGLYKLIDVTNSFEEELETYRTDNLIFNTSRIDWNNIKGNINKNVSTNIPTLTLNASHKQEQVPFSLPKNGASVNNIILSESRYISTNSEMLNERAETNMNIYLPHNIRRNIYNNDSEESFILCRECGQKNTRSIDWCLFCGVLLIRLVKEKSSLDKEIIVNDNCDNICTNSEYETREIVPSNGSIVWRHVEVEEISDRRDTKGVKLDLAGLDSVRSNSGEEWDFDLNEIDEQKSVSSDTTTKHTVHTHHIVPPLDLSVLDSSRELHKVKQSLTKSLDETKENCHKKVRKWATSSSSWDNIPVNILKKKPSSFYRNKLNSCTNKIGITVLQSGFEEEYENISSVRTIETNSNNVVHVLSTSTANNHIFLDKPYVPIDIIGNNYHCDSFGSQWHCLPAEIWINVMKYLTHFHLSLLQQTCRRIYHIGLDSSLWKSIHLYKHYSLNNDHVFSIANKKPKELHFKNCFGTDITYKGLVAMFKICGEGLKKISFVSCSKGAFDDDNFLVLSAAFCPNVTHINASYLMNLQDDTLKKMIEGFTKIESLNIMGAHSISNTSIKSLIEHHRASLINLDLYGCFKLNNRTLPLLESCLNLRSLALGSISNLKRSVLIEMLKKLSQLTILDLRGTMNLVDDSLLRQICQSCPKLQQIILTNSCRLTDSGVIELAKSCVSNSLKILDICGCSKITEKGLEVVLKNCHELEDLDISCTGIKGDGAKYFKMYTPQKLRCLRINNNKFFSSDDLLSLLGSCKKLGTIYMCGSTSIGSWRRIEEQFPNVTFKHE